MINLKLTAAKTAMRSLRTYCSTVHAIYNLHLPFPAAPEFVLVGAEALLIWSLLVMNRGSMLYIPGLNCQAPRVIDFDRTRQTRLPGN